MHKKSLNQFILLVFKINLIAIGSFVIALGSFSQVSLSQDKPVETEPEPEATPEPETIPPQPTPEPEATPEPETIPPQPTP
ncbi:hypothetical protein, partial [Rivularia sp. UHCC 0363]|uniref:hypothetical protein n=1 Tax=Rivularia sp. UHCC 0363 TaxID=3110244 RepID=UPI002B20F106